MTILTHSTAQTSLSAIDSPLEKACHLILGFENQYSSLLVVLFIVLYSQKHNFSPFQNHLYSIARVKSRREVVTGELPGLSHRSVGPTAQEFRQMVTSKVNSSAGKELCL